MSKPGLILYRDQAETSSEKFLDQVILLVVHRRPAETGHRRDVVNRRALVVPLFEIAVARLLDQSRDAIHRPIERALFPMVGVRRSVENLLDAVRVDGELKCVRALRTERALVDRAVVIALD